MPLPTLQPMNISQAQPVSNYLAGQKYATDRNRTQQNELRAQAQEGRAVSQEGRSAIQFGQRQTDRETEKKHKLISMRSDLLSKASRAANKEQANQILKSGGTEIWPEGVPEYKFEGDKQTVTFADGASYTASQRIMVEANEAHKKNPEFMTDPKYREELKQYIIANGGSWTEAPKGGLSSGKGTETERYAARHGITLLEAKRRIKLATQIGMSDDDKRSYDVQDDRAYRTENEIRKLKSELAGMPTPKEGEDDFFKPKRDLLKEYEKLLVRHEKKRQDILDKYKKGGKGKAKGIQIPQATIDYWKSKGKTMQQIEDAFYKKYKNNPPKIGF